MMEFKYFNLQIVNIIKLIQCFFPIKRIHRINGA